MSYIKESCYQSIRKNDRPMINTAKKRYTWRIQNSDTKLHKLYKNTRGRIIQYKLLDNLCSVCEK